MIIDYELLKLIWWLFVGVLLIGFALLDGFDLGVGTLLPFVGRTDEQRRVILNAIGPTCKPSWICSRQVRHLMVRERFAGTMVSPRSERHGSEPRGHRRCANYHPNP